MQSPIRLEMTVQEVVKRWPATRPVFRRYGIPTETAACPNWETIEQAAAAQGHWAADQLIGELNQAAGVCADIQPDAPIVEVVRACPATRAIFERYGIFWQADRIAPWESIEQAAAARGHWAADSLLEELNAVCAGEFRQ
jgi:hypothetical protein